MAITLRTGNLGYPRIGENREWKRLLEHFWKGKLEEAELRAGMERVLVANWRRQQERGVGMIPVNDFTYYDHMLDMAVMFGVVPDRFAHGGGPAPLSVYFAMARGSKQAAACEMTKWFNTNYHYIVPEIGERPPELTENKPLEAWRLAKERAGIDGKPVVVGLFTFLKLSKGFPASGLFRQVDRFLPVYVRMLRELAEAGVTWVQVDEPSLVGDVTDEEWACVERLYRAIAEGAPGLNLMLQTYFEAVNDVRRVAALPVAGVGLDFVHDGGDNLRALEAMEWPRDKVLGAGIVDGRNVWRADPDDKLALIRRIARRVSEDRIVLQTSCSLLHVPVTLQNEKRVEPVVRRALAFADEKLEELRLLLAALADDAGGVAADNAVEAADNVGGAEDNAVAVGAAWAACREALQAFRALPERSRADVARALDDAERLPDRRNAPFPERAALQRDRWKLPPLPTTTIGSFPQTEEVRQARQQWQKGGWDDARYERFLEKQIEACVRIQEDIGLDVLVHGEFERTDMVEFFGQQLAGFAFTGTGWVQSYGSRCVKPPIIYADVAFRGPMTVRESRYAQSLTDRPVKGMLTGPVTMLNWSFVRDDLSRERVANQIALALRSEIEALEAEGIGMIQVDEPALREGLPLKERHKTSYLDWSVRAFRIATSTVRDSTQIHTHMCYCEFHDVIDSIREMDADVISLETSRSHGELVRSFETKAYDRGIGLGVYDIHSPRVPEVEEMEEIVAGALRVLDPELFWVNPDCGLKTRGWTETTAALRNMVEAARRARERRLSGT